MTVSWAGSRLHRVRDVMARDVVWVDAQDTIQEALSLMVENKISALPVLDGQDHCVGVLSATDILGLENEMEMSFEYLGRSLLERLQNEGLSDQTVQQLMTTPPVTIDAEATLTVAAQAMLRNRIHHLVVEQQGKAVGILSTMDILQTFVDSQGS